jgi:uncharacterized protein
MALLHGYLWFRLVRSTTQPGRVRRRLTWVVVGLGLSVVVAVPLGSALPLDAAAVLEWPAFIWLGIAFYLFVTLLALEPVRLVARLAGRRRAVPVPAPASVPATTAEPAPAGEPAPDARPSAVPRRVFLARGLAVTAGAVALGTAGTGAVLAANPIVRRVPVTLPRLDPALDGLRIATFSDAHLSSMFRRGRVEEIVAMVNEQRPDVVAIVGDLVDAPVEELRSDVAPLADLVSGQGVYFVTGNHEYFTDDTDAWMRHLPTLGVRVLRNERVAIRRGTASLDLAGIDDRIADESGVPGHGADLDAALDGRDDATPVVLLSHQPVVVEQARAAGVDLQLSGHTHGGQLWPFDYAIRLDQPAVQGLSRVGDTQLFITSGAGFWGPPMRIGARPEVAVIELRSAP